MLGIIIGSRNGLTRSGPRAASTWGLGFHHQQPTTAGADGRPHRSGRASLIARPAWATACLAATTAKLAEASKRLASLRSSTCAGIQSPMTSAPSRQAWRDHQTVLIGRRPLRPFAFNPSQYWEMVLPIGGTRQPCDDDAAETLHHQQPQACLSWMLVTAFTNGVMPSRIHRDLDVKASSKAMTQSTCRESRAEIVLEIRFGLHFSGVDVSVGQRSGATFSETLPVT